MRTFELLEHDLAATFGVAVPHRTTDKLQLFAKAVATVRGLALIGFRISHLLAKTSPVCGRFVKQVTHALTGADIASGARIGPGLRLLHPTGIVIAEAAVIGSYCTIHSCTTIGEALNGAPVIGDNVAIAPGARILGNVWVDDGCHVGANAVLTRSLPGEGMVIAGVPARRLRAVGHPASPSTHPAPWRASAGPSQK
jgi:serine O-acetyltransferase